MPSKTYLNPDTMSQPRGYSHVVKVGNTAYIAGQVSVARDGSVVGKDDPEAQARQIWHNLEAAVKSVGGTLNDIVKTTTYVTNLNYAAAIRKVREERFPTNPSHQYAARCGWPGESRLHDGDRGHRGR